VTGYLKALLASAFFVAALPLAGATNAACTPPTHYQPAALARVIDGDTLVLEDGRHVRLIGINTPELAHDQQPAQPLAREARDAARAFLGHAPLQLVVGRDSQDRHGRTLAHVFDAEGRSLEAALLQRGLGFPLSIPPNLTLRECLNAAAQQAQTQHLGVWSHPDFQPRAVTALQPGDGGFGRYRGRVTAVGQNRSGAFLELEQRLYLPIDPQARELFDLAQLHALTQRTIEVSGWLSYRRLTAAQRARHFRPFRLSLQHPDALQVLRTTPVQRE